MSFRILAFALALMLAACQESQPNRPSSNHTATTYNVLIEKIEERSLPVIYPVPGTIVARDHLQVASRITGYIDHIAVNEGDLVEPGVVLVRIDGTQVEAAIKGMEAAIVSARAELQDAKDDLKRYRALSKTQALPEDQIRDAVVRRTKAEAALA